MLLYARGQTCDRLFQLTLNFTAPQPHMKLLYREKLHLLIARLKEEQPFKREKIKGRVL